MNKIPNKKKAISATSFFMVGVRRLSCSFAFNGNYGFSFRKHTLTTKKRPSPLAHSRSNIVRSEVRCKITVGLRRKNSDIEN